MTMQHPGYFDASAMFAIKNHVAADGEAPDWWIELRSLSTRFGRSGQQLTLFVNLFEK